MLKLEEGLSLADAAIAAARLRFRPIIADLAGLCAGLRAAGHQHWRGRFRAIRLAPG